MTYQVIARKFRPQTFDEVIGQQHVVRTLKNAIKDGRIAHAFLFTGERGVGKTSVARILAKALNCHNGPVEEPCAACASCKEIVEGNAIDVHEIDGASNTGVDDIRALRENVRYLPSRDRYKIYIIDEVHMLSTSAFNALLKTLEEPPEHVIFIFATTEPRKVPDTVISRCLRFDFKRIPSKEIVEHLEAIARNEGAQITRRGLFLISRESEGSMRDAQSLLERAISYCRGEVKDSDLEEMLGLIDRKSTFRIMESVFSEDPQGCIDGLTSIYEAGGDLRQFYYSFLELLRDVMVVQATQDSSRLVDVSDEDMEKLKDYASGASRDVLHRCFRLWFSAEGEITRSAFPRIALEVCLLEMCHMKRSIPVEAILSRIDDLKKRMEGTGGPATQTSRPVGRFEEKAAPDKQAAYAPVEPVSAGVSDPDVKDFFAFVRKKHPPTAALLEHGDIQINGDGELRVEFAEASFHFEKISEDATRNRFQRICDDFFSKPVKLTIVGSREKKKSRDRDEQDLKQKKRELEREAENNPVIKKVCETFNGSILEVKTDI